MDGDSWTPELSSNGFVGIFHHWHHGAHEHKLCMYIACQSYLPAACLEFADLVRDAGDGCTSAAVQVSAAFLKATPIQRADAHLMSVAQGRRPTRGRAGAWCIARVLLTPAGLHPHRAQQKPLRHCHCAPHRNHPPLSYRTTDRAAGLFVGSTPAHIHDATPALSMAASSASSSCGNVSWLLKCPPRGSSW